MFAQLRDSTEQQLWREATTDWLAPHAGGLASRGRPELVTLVLAVLRGLLLDLDATGDAERVHSAFADLLGLLPGGGSDR